MRYAKQNIKTTMVQNKHIKTSTHQNNNGAK